MAKRPHHPVHSISDPPKSGVVPGASTAPDPDAHPPGLPGTVRRFRLTVVDGPAKGLEWVSSSARCSMGSHASNSVVVQDPTVSRFHCEISIDIDGARLRDLESRNGTVLDGVAIIEAFLRTGSLVRLGKTVLRFDMGMEINRLPISEKTRFGSLIGSSIAMRSVFALVERAAASDATVLLQGETGTGKSQAAAAIHQASARKDHPFMVLDNGAIPAGLLESELFGHEKGAFTGATERRVGVFEEASGGTLFLDEIGELPLDLQAKLLRVLEAREVRRIGSNAYRKVDVRVIGATNKDLRTEVNAGRFRADLYFRLAVLTIELPPLRRRPDDIPVLLDEILDSLQIPETNRMPLRSPEFLAQLQRGAWPGNVRELRNFVERCSILQTMSPMDAGHDPIDQGIRVDSSRAYATERERVLHEFERAYLEGLVRDHAGRIVRAAEAAGLDRTYLYRLLRRHGMEP